MKKLLLFIFINFSFLYSSSFYDNLDKYHYIISQWLLDKTDLIDRYLADINTTKRVKNKTKIDISFEIGKFTNINSFYHNLDYSLNLDLPRFQNKWKLKLEKIKQHNFSILKSNEELLSKTNRDKNTTFNLSLFFTPIKGKKSIFSLDGGVRFNKKFLIDPYIGVVIGRKLKKNQKKDFNIKNNIRFYLSGEFKDLLKAFYFYKYENNQIVGWNGNFVWSSEVNTQYFSSEIFSLKFLNKNSFYKVGFISTASLKNFKHLRKEDFEFYIKYRDKLLNKKWLYYEITPATKWERKNNYKTSIGIKLKIGAIFGVD